MGTRADFYSSDYEWLGSIAWNGYPDGMSSDFLGANSEEGYIAALESLKSRDDWTSPQDGWPWPWDNSNTTDYAYIYKEGSVLCSCFGGQWRYISDADKDDEDPSLPDLGIPEHPQMDSSNFTMGERSGLIVL